MDTMSLKGRRTTDVHLLRELVSFGLALRLISNDVAESTNVNIQNAQRLVFLSFASSLTSSLSCQAYGFQADHGAAPQPTRGELFPPWPEAS